MMRTQKGFTLIELMIVVAIIAIIAAIAIPNLLRARIAANESSAIGSLRTIASAQTTAQNSALLDVLGGGPNGVGEYMSLAQLSGVAAPNPNPPFIDTQLGAGSKSGYQYQMTIAAVGTAETAWECEATPQSYSGSGVRSFYVDESGVVRGFDTGGNAFQGRAVCTGWQPVGG